MAQFAPPGVAQICPHFSLDRELDRIQLIDEQINTTNAEGELRPIIPIHGNIRGAESYQ